jgi:hypothetical protein
MLDHETGDLAMRERGLLPHLMGTTSTCVLAMAVRNEEAGKLSWLLNDPSTK